MKHLDLATLLVRRVEDELLSRDNGLVCRVRCHPNPMDRGIIAIIENIIVLFGVSPYWQGVVSGVIVVLAISFDALSRRYIRRAA